MTKSFNPSELKNLYTPPPGSHKGQNGKLMVIGGSHLFHAASLWSLKVATRIVDMVFYASVPENNEIVQKNKEAFHDGIVVPRDHMDMYMHDADAVLIGPGMPREDGRMPEEEATRALTHRLLETYPHKRWIIDAGALTEMEAAWLKPLEGNVILTPHRKEFEKLFGTVIATPDLIRGKQSLEDEIATSPDGHRGPRNDAIERVAKEFNCIVLLKGQTDIVCSPSDCVMVEGGNAGMTKGGTGDVLAGLVAALACKNDLFLAAKAGSYINKKAGESLYNKVGPYFNASDLADEIPGLMAKWLK